MTAREMMDLWVVEYSPTQKALHVHQIDDAIQANSRMILENRRANDYLMIGVAQSREQADAICEVFKTKLEINGLR